MRPRKCRKVDFDPQVTIFKPSGIPMRLLDYVELELDEAEAIRLADYKELYHEEAGKKMGISRQTFSRLLNKAHKKVSDAIINGKCLIIKKNGSTMIKEHQEMPGKCLRSGKKSFVQEQGKKLIP